MVEATAKGAVPVATVEARTPLTFKPAKVGVAVLPIFCGRLRVMLPAVLVTVKPALPVRKANV